MSPRPASVRYNDWRQVDMGPPETFAPAMPVSVIVPCWRTPAETLAMTLAALEGQTYPRDMFEVVLVDDGSDPPLALPGSTPLDVRTVRQERRGFGAARARNAGARAAAHDILLFLDSDMLAERNWIAAHARWHHAVSDALTVGFRTHAEIDGVGPEAIRRRPGSLKDLLAGRPTEDTPGIEEYMAETDDLASRADDPYAVATSANLGIGRSFHELAGGFDESFARWGLEDNEFGYRAYLRGGLLIPVRDAGAWHQGLWSEGREAKRRSARIQRAKAAHSIAHPRYRAAQPGRFFAAPQFVVTVDGRHDGADRIVRARANVLADRESDLAVRIETDADGDALARLREEFDPDPRVRVAPSRSALEEFPSSPFHIALPVRAALSGNPVRRLRAELGDAVEASAALPDGTRASIVRTWALNRARRAGKTPADFGDVRAIRAGALKFAERRDDGAERLRGVRRARAFLKRAARAARRETG